MTHEYTINTGPNNLCVVGSGWFVFGAKLGWLALGMYQVWYPVFELNIRFVLC